MTLASTSLNAASPSLGRASWLGRSLAYAGLPEMLVAGALLVNLLVVLVPEHFPYQDAPNHLARYVLIDRILSGQAVAETEFRWIPSPYLALDLLGVACVRLFGVVATGKILAALSAVLPTLGMYFLLRAAAPSRRGWAVVGALLAFSWFLLAGLLTYVIGLGLALCCIAWWWPRRASPHWSVPIGMAAWMAVLFLVHLSAPLIVLGVVGVHVALLLVTGGMGAFPWLREPSLRVLGLCGLMFLAMWWWTAGSGEVGFDSSASVVFRSAASKIAAIGAPFYSFSLAQAGFMAAAYLALLLGFVTLFGKRILLDPFLVASVVFFLLFLAFPRDVAGAGGTDIRWLLPAYILPFCATGEPRRAALHSPFLLLAAFALSVINAAVIFSWTVRIDRQLADFDRALKELPAGSRVLPLIFTKDSYPRVTPYEQYALWHIIRAQGTVPGLWALFVSLEGHAPLPHMQHFLVARRYYPVVASGLDWNRIAAEYDFIVLAADQEPTRAQIGSVAPQMARFGRVSIHQPPARPPS